MKEAAMDYDPKRELALGRLFLGRLSRLIVKEAVVKTPEERRLVDWAIYSTCCDCYDLGLHEEVVRLLAVRRPKHEDSFDRWLR
jgi:hypothetical protein